MQGVEIGDKHIEVMVRQMLRKVRVMDPGDSGILPGTLLDIADFKDRNYDTLVAGGVPATSRPVLLGITKASLKPTASCLLRPSRNHSCVDRCSDPRQERSSSWIEENVIIGKIIPAGTGMPRYREMEQKK